MRQSKFTVLVAALAVTSCSSLPPDVQEWLDHERVFLVGPLEAIEEDPTPTDTVEIDGQEVEITPMGVSLSLFSDVEILEERDGRVRFRRSVAYHPDNTGWGPASAFLKESEFAPLSRWDGPTEATFCDEFAGCYSMSIRRDATFELTQTPKTRGDCYIRDYRHTRCRVFGRLYQARLFIRLVADSGYDDFFSIKPDGSLCWIRGMEMYKQCLPHNKPLHPTTSGGLTAAVVAGERRR